MLSNKLIALALAGALVATSLAPLLATAEDVVVDPAIATMTTEQLVAAREAAMKQNGGILRGITALQGEEAIAAADAMIQNFTNLPAMFPEGSSGGKALPVIWQEREGFDALFAQGREHAIELKAALEAGDAAAVGAASQAIGGLCGQCHQKYRAAS